MATFEEIVGRQPTEEEAEAWSILGSYFKTAEELEQENIDYNKEKATRLIEHVAMKAWEATEGKIKKEWYQS